MARLLLVAALCLASVKAAVIPVEEIVDNLQVQFSFAFNTLTFVYFCNNSFSPQSFLTAPEESGLRLKRSTGEWDKEFDLSSMGILFQLKYNNPANPFEQFREEPFLSLVLSLLSFLFLFLFRSSLPLS